MNDLYLEDDFLQDGLETFDSALYHHGILGQIHGVRNGPPYPLDSGRHSTSEKKAGWKKSLVAAGGAAAAKLKKKYKDVQTVQQAKAKAKAEAEKKAKEEAEKKAKEQTKGDIASAMRTGNRDEINRLKDSMTNDELSKALDRARLVDQIGRRTDAETERIIRSGDYNQIKKSRDDMSYDELQNAINRIDLNRRLESKAPKDRNGWDKVDNAMRRLDQINQWADIGIKSYNNIARIHNSFNPNAQPMPTIKGGGKDKDGKNNNGFSKKDAEKMFNDFSDKMQKEMNKQNQRDQSSSPDQNAGGNGKQGKKNGGNNDQQQPQNQPQQPNPTPKPSNNNGGKTGVRPSPQQKWDDYLDSVLNSNHVSRNPTFKDIYDTPYSDLEYKQVRRGKSAFDFAVNTWEEGSYDFDRYRG